MVINGGAGNDTIKSWGQGAVVAEGGAGDDVIFVGQNTVSNAHNAVWALNAATTNPQDRLVYWDDFGGAQPLNNNVAGGSAVFTYTVSTGNASQTNIVTGAALEVSINFLGFTGKASLGTAASTAGTYSFTAEQINEAIAKAVADSPTLKHVLAVKDGAGHSLMFESLINHTMTAGDLGIAFNQISSTGVSTGITFADAAYVTPLAAIAQSLAYEIAPVGVVNMTSTGDADGGPIYQISGIPTPVASTSYYAVKVDGVMYSSNTAAAGTTDGDIITALRLAVDVNGNALTDKYGVADPAGTGTISIRVKDAGVADRVEVQLYTTDLAAAGTILDGSNVTGNTQSNNIVEGGAGNDVIVLNPATAIGEGDLVRLSGAFGDDALFNYTGNNTGNPALGYDGFDVTSLLKINQATPLSGQIANVAATTTVSGGANAIALLTGGEHTTAGGGSYAGGYTEAEVRAMLSAASSTVWGQAGDTSLYFILDNSTPAGSPGQNADETGKPAGANNKYTVVQVVEGGDNTLSAADTVNVLGTITMDSDQLTINANDFYVFS